MNRQVPQHFAQFLKRMERAVPRPDWKPEPEREKTPEEIAAEQAKRPAPTLSPALRATLGLDRDEEDAA